MKKIQSLISAMLTSSMLLFGASRAFGLDLDPNEIRGKSSKEPMTILQNRYFLKSYRPEVGLYTGMLLDEAYVATRTSGGRVGMFFNEWFGIDLAVMRTTVRDSDDRKALNRLKYRPLVDSVSSNTDPSGSEREVIVSPDPEVNALRGMQDFTAVAAPFYGKLNLLNQWIVYTDLYASVGISRVETDQGNKSALVIGGGERFYIGKSWSVRIDIKDRIFTETRGGQSSRRNSYGIDFGASYFFN
jgi:outer membrane beta-barrel protein